MSEVKDRLVEFIEYLKIDIAKFERTVGLSNGAVSKTNDRIRKATVNLIGTAYPELNTDWLISGNGSMLKTQSIGEINSSTVVGANVNGSGNTITNNDVAGLIELQKGYQDMIREKDKQIDRLLTIIENLNK